MKRFTAVASFTAAAALALFAGCASSTARPAKSADAACCEMCKTKMAAGTTTAPTTKPAPAAAAGHVH